MATATLKTRAQAAMTRTQAAERIATIVHRDCTVLRNDVVQVAPADMREVAEVLRFCNAQGLVVTAVGGRTKLGWGNPVDADIELSLERLKVIREHAWQDMTCSVEAGCTWGALQAELSQHGQMIALDPLWPERATVGGIVATNDGGALRLKYGGLRDLIIGMTVVLADGTLAKTGGKVVKNVAGYDLHKLMTGSFGTLGVIVSVNFRLHPLEEHTRTWTAAASLAGEFAAPLAALLDSQMTPSGVQIRATTSGSELDICMAAPPECFDEHAKQLKKTVGHVELVESGMKVWRAREELSSDANAVVLKVSLPVDCVCPIVTEMQREAESSSLKLSIVAQATGIAIAALTGSQERAIAWVESFRSKVIGLGGSVVILQLPVAWGSKVDVWGPEPSAIGLMRAIKQKFDPGRILNPGRFVGNI